MQEHYTFRINYPTTRLDEFGIVTTFPRRT